MEEALEYKILDYYILGRVKIANNDVWYLVPWPKDKNVIGTKWIFKNKQDENRIIVRNKARLVA